MSGERFLQPVRSLPFHLLTNSQPIATVARLSVEDQIEAQFIFPSNSSV